MDRMLVIFNPTAGRRRIRMLWRVLDLLLLNECDMGGRVPGASVGTVDDALGFIKEVERSNRGK